MGDLSEFKFSVQLFLKGYPWRKIKHLPRTDLKKSLSECRVGLVSTAGFVLPGQPEFDPAIKGGDSGYREIPDDTDLTTLSDCHRSDSFDHNGMLKDKNLAFPIHRLQELVQEGYVGEVNRRHISVMGSITTTGRLIRDTAPAVANLFSEDQVDVVLLVPV